MGKSAFFADLKRSATDMKFCAVRSLGGSYLGPV
jgi:hypothetical protein